MTDGDCSAVTQCWSGSNRLLVNSAGQADKFCLCAAGTYESGGTTLSKSKKATAYGFTDTGENPVWSVARVTAAYPIQKVVCGGLSFPTNVNYFSPA